MAENPDPILTPGTEAAPAILARPSVTADGVGGAARAGDEVIVAVQPTQVRRPWRTTVRSAFQAFVALAVLLPFLVEGAGLDVSDAPWLAIPLAVAAAVTRIMALPQVETFLRTFLPFLAATPKE